jgi:hypothetical protein
MSARRQVGDLHWVRDRGSCSGVEIRAVIEERSRSRRKTVECDDKARTRNGAVCFDPDANCSVPKSVLIKKMHRKPLV